MEAEEQFKKEVGLQAAKEVEGVDKAEAPDALLDPRHQRFHKVMALKFGAGEQFESENLQGHP